MPENPIITPITFDPNKQLTSLQKGQTNHLNIEANESFGLKASDFGVSQYDKPQETSWNELRTGDYNYLRGERQGLWDKAGNGLVNMLGKTLSTAAEGIANPFYGTIAALTHTDKNGKWDPSLNSYYNNDLTKQLDKFNEAVDKNNPFYSDKEEATATGLAKLWHANTLFRDILGGAGTTIGAGLTGGAWSKAFSIFGKAMGAAQTVEEATLIANAVKEGTTESLKSVANAATKKQIKDGIRQGTIAAMSATGEAGAEARETQKNIYLKLTTNPDGSPKQLTDSELAYAKMMSEQAGDMAFGMNLPVIMADNWLTFGKALFGNKTNDFAKLANKATFFDDATKTWKAVEKGKYANLAYRAGKIGVPMLSEGNQEILQFGIGKAAEDYYVNKYYNPNAVNFLDSFTKGMAEAYTSQEGIHAGIIGALSAGIASPGMVLVGKGRQAFKDEFITNPEDKLTAQAVESLNKYKVEDLRKKFVDNFVRSANLTEIKDQAIDENNDFNYHNANEDMLFSYAYNRLQNGKLNDTKEELNNFKDLTVEELKNIYGIDVNVENKASIEQLTGKGAVQKYVQDRLDKLAKIEETYNQVTKLFPEAHPDVKELLIYSAQGLENAKQRKTEVAAKVTKILQENSEAFTSIGFAEALLNKESKDHNMLMYSAMDPKSFAKAYNELDVDGKKLFKKQITEADGISPLHQEEILKALDDVENLKSREIDFTLTYNALKDPKNQAIFLSASDNLWGKFYDLAKAKDLQDVQDRVNNIQQDINTKLSKSFGIDNGGLSALNILPNLGNIDASNVKASIKALEEDNNISPLIRQDVVNKIQDLVKLKERQQQFITEYKALSNPKLQALLDVQDSKVEEEISNTVAEHKIKQEVSKAKANLEETSVDLSQLSDFAEPTSNVDPMISFLGDKIINRQEGEQFSPEEQQEYENNKEAVEAYIKSKADAPQPNFGFTVAVTKPTVIAETNKEVLSNGVTTSVDVTTNQDDEFVSIKNPIGKEFTSKRANALMSKFFKFNDQTKTWLRDENGEVVEENGEAFSKENNTPEVSRDINLPNVGSVGTEVTYNHNGKDIWLTDNNGIVLGYIGLENSLPENSSDEVVAAREELIKNRKEILSKPSGSIKTIIAAKGNGKLLTKIDSKNQLILDQQVSSRPEDMIDSRPLFLYDDGESLSAKNTNDLQNEVVIQFQGTTFSKENPNGGTRIGVGRVYQAVKTADGSWYVIPVYTNLLKDLKNFQVVANLALATFRDNIIDSKTSDYNKIINTLQKFIFVTNNSRYSKNPNVVRIVEDKEKQNEGYVTVGGEKISFSDLKEGVNTDKFVEALGTIRANLSIDSLNEPLYTRNILGNNYLVTNAYTDATGSYYVQPYLEVFPILEEETTESIPAVTSNNEQEFKSEEKSIETPVNPFEGQKMTDDIDLDSSEAPAFSKTKLAGTEVNQKSKKTLKKILPGLQLADEQLVEEVGKNLKDTYGMFHNMLIYLFKGATNQTMFHEAFHGVFRNVLSDTERIAVLNEAKVKYDAPDTTRLEFLRQGEGNSKLNIEALTQLHYEERLADDFAKYLDGQVNPSLGQRILNFFKKIFDLFNIFRNASTSQIEQVFENTTKGVYAKRSIAASLLNKAIDLNKFGNAYSRVFTDGSIPLSAELDRTNAIANVLLAKVSEQMAKGTALKDIDINGIANAIRNHYLKVANEEALKPEADRNMNKGILAYQVANKFAEILENAKRQISLTKKINFKGNFIDTSVIKEEGVIDATRENEEVTKVDSDKGKGFQEMTAISGIKTATHKIKLFLSNLPVLKDGVIQRDSFGFPLYHPFEKIYYKLEQSLVGTTTFSEQLGVMRSLARFSPEIKQVVQAIESITDKEKLTNFKQQFAANFNKQVLNYKLMTYSKKGNTFKFDIINPNRKDVSVNLNSKWTGTNITDPTNKTTDDIRVFNDKLAVFEVSKEKVKKLIEGYWENINGKNTLIGTYTPTIDNTYELAQKLGIGLSYDTIVEYAKLDDKNLKELTNTLLNYADTMYVNVKFSNARNYLNKLIKLETDVQTELFTSSFNNVENSVVYAIQHQSFASKLIKELTNNTSASLELNDKLQSDPINYKNFVLENTKGLEMFPIDGLKMQGDNIEGKKFNQIHSDDYLAMVINMFNNDKDKDKLGTEAKAIYAPIIPAEKGLAFAFAGSKITVGLDENKQLIKDSLIHTQFEQLVFNELARIRQVMIDLKTLPKEQLIDNYHTKKKLGLQFNMTDAINPVLKAKLDAVIESTLDVVLPDEAKASEYVQELIKDELLTEVKEAVHNNLQDIISKHLELAKQKNVIFKKEDGSYATNKFTGDVNTIIANWALNSYLFNASISTLINGDSAFYKGAEDNGKRFYQGYSMLKFADTSIIDDSFKYLKGGKMKINVIKDVELASLSVPTLEEFAELTGNSNIAKLAQDEYGKDNSINAADAQIFVSVAIYQELEKLFGNDSQQLREGFTNADIADALNRKEDKGILTIKKPFFYGVQFDTKLNRYVPIQVKCSIFPISNKFVKNNSLLAKHKALMDADQNYPQVLAFESTMKALSPFKANIQDPNNPSIVELDLNNYGEQVANPDHMTDSHNDSLRQLKMLFYGMVENDKEYIDKSGRELKDEIALLDKANIEESLNQVVKAFKGNEKELMKFIQDAISSRNATSIMEDVFTQDVNGKFQYPLDLINSKTTIQLISSIFSDRAIRQKFTGGSAPQASSVGLQIAPKESNYKNAAEFQKAVEESKTLTEIQSSLKWVTKADDKSIDYIEAYAPAHAKEFFNEDGAIKDNIPDELKQMLVYRIPTEGAHSMMAIKVVGFLPAEYGGAMLLPLEVTKQFGADFDFDKIFFISKEFYSTKDGLTTYGYIEGTSERAVKERYKKLINYTLQNDKESRTLVKETNKEISEFDYTLSYDDKIQVLLDNGILPFEEDFAKLSVEEQNIKPARNNRLLDNYMKILRSSNMLESLITPSGPGAIADIYDKVKEPIKIGNFFTPLYQLFNKDLFHKISMLKGVAALQVSGHAWATEGKLKVKDKITPESVIERGVKIKGKGIYQDLSRVMSDANSKIVEELSSMMAVILDAVKTPDQLPSIGISMKTLPMWSYLARLGLGSRVASQFTSQQAIKDLSLVLEANDIQLKDKSFIKKDINTVKQQYNELYTEAYNKLREKIEIESKTNANASSLLQRLDKITPAAVANFKQLSLEDLEKFTGKKADLAKLQDKDKLDYLILQITTLNIFDESQSVIKELNQLNNLFSINKETGPNFEDVNGKLSVYTTLTSKETLVDGISDLLHSNAIYPYIKTLQSQMDVMQDHYNFASPFFNAIKDRVATSQILGDTVSLTSLKDDARNIINGFVQMYLDAENTFKPIYDGSSKLSRKEFLTDLKLILSSKTHTNHKFKVMGDITISEKEQQWLKSMTLFKSLEVVSIKNSSEAYAALKGGRYELHQKELMINDITSLYNSKFKPLAEALIYHSFENTGFYTGTNSYFAYIHPSVLQSMGLVSDRNKVKPTLQSDYYNAEVLDNIVDQLVRNNAKKFTKVYDNEKNLFLVDDNGKTLIVSQETKDKVKLKEITDGNNHVKYIRFVLNDDFTPIYRLDETASSDNNIVYRQVSYLGSPGKLVEINPFKEVETILPNNKYEKFVVKGETIINSLSNLKDFAEKETVPVEQPIEDQPNADNTENVANGQTEKEMTEADLLSMFGGSEDNLETTENYINLAEDPKFNEWYGSELERNPDISLEEALEYYKNCKQ